MATVKELIDKLSSLRQTARVYEKLKSTLESHLQLDDETSSPLRMGDGTVVSEEVINNVLVDLDEFGLGPVIEEIKRVERAEVANEHKESKGKPISKPKKAKRKRK